MQRFFFAVAIAYSGCTWAHTDHDWRLDKRAFESAHLDEREYPRTRINAGVTISESEFKTAVQQLSGAIPVVINGQTVTLPADRGGKPGRDLARRWLAQEYTTLGYTCTTDAFPGGANLIAEKAGTSGKVLVLSSHMDSVYNPGANDDGAGTVAALLIAKALRGLPMKNTLRVIAFDREEAGLVGSESYARRFDSSGFMGDIQLEMMAFNSKKDGRFHVIDCDRSDSMFLTTAIMGSVNILGLPITRVAACTDRSDHAAFWQQGLPAVVLSENFFGGDGDTCYHQPCDKVDARLDFKYAANIATAVANALANLLQGAPPTGAP